MGLLPIYFIGVAAGFFTVSAGIKRFDQQGEAKAPLTVDP